MDDFFVLVRCVLCNTEKHIHANQLELAVHRHCPRNGFAGQRYRPYPPRMVPVEDTND